MSRPYVHLNIHSEYSLADGIVRIKPLAQQVSKFSQPSVALTDISNLYATVKFYKACLQQGIKPLIGADVWIQNPVTMDSTDRTAPDRVKLLCLNNVGYRHLCTLLTRAFLRGQKQNRVVVDWDDLEQLGEGLIALLDDQDGPVANAISQNSDNSTDILQRYRELLEDRLYLEISRIGRPAEEEYIRHATMLATQFEIGLVATNRVVYLTAEEFEAHEIRVCINDGRVLEDSRRPRRYTNQQYLRSSEEMVGLFEDFPEAIDNTVEIARRCNLFLGFDRDFLPDYPGVDDRSVAQVLSEQTETGLAHRLGVDSLWAADGSSQIPQEYLDRMKMELDVIQQMGFPGYFLIVADFIRWSRENGIPVGPGRGSGAGSLVAWATGITELDPLTYGLLFERFLNPERVSLPDFDIDFCVEGRDRVIEYVANRYGRDQVAQIITFGTMAAKAVVRDVGRVMSLPYGFVDQVAKLIPFEIGMTLKKALDQEEVLRNRFEDEAEIQELIDMAIQLEGIARNVGKHAGGVVIAPKPLTEFTPLYADTHLNQAITQFDKDDLESIGLVKFDFLGLRTLTIIDWAVKMVNQQRHKVGEAELVLDDSLPLDDKDTFKLIQAGHTTAIFQLESRGMKELILRLRPDTFEELVALVALFRPGPLQSGMVDDFINRKHGREQVRYPHPDIAPVLQPTYGVILYQEQVMQIAQVLAGFTLGGADLLRRAMGKKKPQEMAKQRELFARGAEERGVDKDVAEYIFDLMEKFAGYGFNKSHSAAYALVSYHTAWLKAHYPAAFMAATMSADIDNTDKVVMLRADAMDMGLEVLPPDINACDYGFQPIDDRKILYGVGALKGVGRGVIENIVEERERGGDFENLFDFCRRVDGKKVNKRVLEALIKSGAMDKLNPNRAAMMADVKQAMHAAGQQQSDLEAGQSDMFGVAESPLAPVSNIEVPEWTEDERLVGERETLGVYLTGHPYNRYATEFAQIIDQDIQGLDLATPKNGVFAGLVVAMRVLNTRRGKMAFVTLDNGPARIEASLFSNKFTEYADILHKDNILVVQGELSTDEYTGNPQMRAETLLTVGQLRSQFLGRIALNISESELDSDGMKQLHGLLGQYSGGQVTVTIHYKRAGGERGVVRLGADWNVRPDQELFGALSDMFGSENLKYHYNVAAIRSGPPKKATLPRQYAVA
ncbi:MAG: DNA polymerase III subunit alpha [Arenicellales bacterium]